MTQNYPPFAVFPDLNCVLRTPSGTEYRGKLRQHPTTEVDGEFWYEGYLRAEQKDHVTADTTLKDRFNRDGLRPAYFHASSNAELLRLKLNRIPKGKRNDKNGDSYRLAHFRRDYKREKSGVLGPKLDELIRDVVGMLAADQPLPPRYRDHSMVGNWDDHRDCHVRPDLVLIYRKKGDDVLQLVRLGSHSELGI